MLRRCIRCSVRCAVVVVCQACDTAPTSLDLSSTRSFATSDTVYMAAPAPDRTVRIPFTVTNLTTQVLFIPACDGVPLPPQLEQEAARRSVVTDSVPSGCAIESSIAMAPGDTLADTAVVVVGAPAFVPDTAARYRLALLIFAFDVNIESPTSHLVAQSERTSNRFRIRL